MFSTREYTVIQSQWQHIIVTVGSTPSMITCCYHIGSLIEAELLSANYKYGHNTASSLNE